MLHTLATNSFRANNVVKNIPYAQNTKVIKNRVLVSFPTEYYHKEQRKMVASKIIYSVSRDMVPEVELKKLLKQK